MPTTRKMLHVYANRFEAAWIKQQAKTNQMSVSKYLLSLVPGIRRVNRLKLVEKPGPRVKE